MDVWQRQGAVVVVVVKVAIMGCLSCSQLCAEPNGTHKTLKCPVHFLGTLNRHCFFEKFPYFPNVSPVAIEMILGGPLTPELSNIESQREYCIPFSILPIIIKKNGLAWCQYAFKAPANLFYK